MNENSESIKNRSDESARRLPGIFLSLFTLVVLLAWYGVSIARGIEIYDGDDLVRSVMAGNWSLSPYIFPEDMYWLTLPTMVRGTWLAVLKIVGVTGADGLRIATGLVSIAYLFAGWALLIGIIKRFEGGITACWIFTLAFLLNLETFTMSGSAFSEPDFLFWILLALSTLIKIETEDRVEGRDVLMLGVSLALACMTRYEAWSVALAIMIFFPLRYSKILKPSLKYLALGLPVIPIVIWLVAAQIRIGNPFGFLDIEESYIGVSPGSQSLFAMIETIFRQNYFVTPIVFIGAIKFIWDRRSSRAVRWIGLVLFILGAWTAYGLYQHQPTMRFPWPATLILCALGSIALEKWIDRRDPQAQMAVLVAALIGGVVVFAADVNGRRPYIPSQLRAFAAEINRGSAEGEENVLLRDYDPRINELELQTFRLFIDRDRLIECLWIEGGCDRLEPRQVEELDLRFIVSRSFPIDLPVERNPLAQNSDGWVAWRIIRE